MISVFSKSSVLQGFVKGRSALQGNASFVPPAFESIATITGSDQSEITFSSIPQTYKHLQIRGVYKDTNVDATGAGSMWIRLNADTGSNYTFQNIVANDTTLTSEGTLTTSQLKIQGAALRTVSGGALVAASIIEFLDYSSTSKVKTLRASAGCVDSAATIQAFGLSQGQWNNTAAITSITLRNYVVGFGTNSSFALYGIKG